MPSLGNGKFSAPLKFHRTTTVNKCSQLLMELLHGTCLYSSLVRQYWENEVETRVPEAPVYSATLYWWLQNLANTFLTTTFHIPLMQVGYW